MLERRDNLLGRGVLEFEPNVAAALKSICSAAPYCRALTGSRQRRVNPAEVIGSAEEQSALGSTDAVDRIQESRQAHADAAVTTIVAVGLVFTLSEGWSFLAAFRVSVGHRTIAVVSGSYSVLGHGTNISSITTMALAGTAASSSLSLTSLHLPSVSGPSSPNMSNPLRGVEVNDVNVQSELGCNSRDCRKRLIVVCPQSH